MLLKGDFMEFLVGAAIIIILLFCLGVDWGMLVLTVKFIAHYKFSREQVGIFPAVDKIISQVLYVIKGKRANNDSKRVNQTVLRKFPRRSIV